MSAPYLSFKEIKLEDVPAADSPEFNSFLEKIYAEADALLVGTEDEKKHADWDVSKPQESGTVACKTRKSRKSIDNGLKWHCRTSYHDAPAYEVFKEYMQEKRLETVQQYMSSMEELVLLDSFADGKIGAFYTCINLPIGAKREFAGIAVNRQFDDSKHFMIITVPLSTPETKGGVKGLYCAVEDVQVIERNGKSVVQWRKAALSSPRGSIPQFLSEGKVEATIAKDVTDFMDFCKEKDMQANALPIN